MTRKEALEYVNNMWMYEDTKNALETLIPEFGKAGSEKVIDHEDKYKEALLEARAVLEPCLKYSKGKVREALDSIDNELKRFESEDEDERIRKWLVNYFKAVGKSWIHRDISPEQILSYLEKQKYNRLQPVYDNQESFESALDKAWKAYNDCGSRTVDSCEDDYIESAYAKGFREGYLFGLEKQKEQKPKAKAKSPLSPHELYDAKIEGISQGRQDVLDHPEQFGLQKPAEWSESDTLMCNAALELLHSHPNLMASHGINKSSVIRWLQSFRPQKQGFIDDICSKAGISIPYLDGNQWCILKGDNIQSGVVGFGDTKEDALANFIKDVPIRHQWSEEDEKMLDSIIKVVCGVGVQPNGLREKQVSFLKSLRPQYHGDVTMTEAYKMGLEAGKASSWKPSEEQMDILKAVKDYVGKGSGYWGEGLGSLIDDLEKL